MIKRQLRLFLKVGGFVLQEKDLDRQYFSGL